MAVVDGDLEEGAAALAAVDGAMTTHHRHTQDRNRAVHHRHRKAGDLASSPALQPVPRQDTSQAKGETGERSKEVTELTIAAAVGLAVGLHRPQVTTTTVRAAALGKKVQDLGALVGVRVISRRKPGHSMSTHRASELNSSTSFRNCTFAFRCTPSYTLPLTLNSSVGPFCDMERYYNLQLSCKEDMVIFTSFIANPNMVGSNIISISFQWYLPRSYTPQI